MVKPEIRLYHLGDTFFQSALESIRRAESKILLEFYIFEYGTIGRLIVEELIKASQRGVSVYLLVDAIGSFEFIRNPPYLKGIQFRVYHPLPFQQKWSWRQFRGVFFLLSRINKRNHRKTIIIDQKTVYIGSRNISDVHSEAVMGKLSWRDTQVKLSFLEPNAETQLLEEAFFEAWRGARRRSPLNAARAMKNFSYWKKAKSYYFQLNSRIHWRYANLYRLNKKIVTAQKQVLISNAYFVPQRSLFQAICTAAQRGVDVRLCLPKKSDVWLVLQASRSLYSRLMKDGVKIYEYEPSVLHVKNIIIDNNWAAVGSHNLNYRSLFHDLEVQVIIHEQEKVKELTDQWNIDLQKSHLLTRDDLNRVPLLNKIISAIIYCFRYWL